MSNRSGGNAVSMLPEDGRWIDAVCLIPEARPRESYPDPDRFALDVRLGELLADFAARFAAGYFVSVTYGLVPLSARRPYSGKLYSDLDPSQRHAFIRQLGEQLKEVMRGGKPVVSLLGSVLATATRNLPITYIMPMASMSRTKRRAWLTAQLLRPASAVSVELFGRELLCDSRNTRAVPAYGPSLNGTV